jgi:hypothetical protein
LGHGILDPEKNFRTKLGGVPYLPEEQEYFADLAAHMATCPYNCDITIDRVVKETVLDDADETGPLAIVQRHLSRDSHLAA